MVMVYGTLSKPPHQLLDSVNGRQHNIPSPWLPRVMHKTIKRSHNQFQLQIDMTTLQGVKVCVDYEAAVSREVNICTNCH